MLSDGGLLMGTPQTISITKTYFSPPQLNYYENRDSVKIAEAEV